MNLQKNILIAPLDWGLGHATRIMPLIDLLLKKQQRVIIAGNGDSFFLLKEQYPNLTFYELPGYNISYPSGKNASVQTLLQTPKVLKTIQQENKIVAEIVAKENIQLIISDNRYGVRNEKIKSIFICHQIALQAPNSMRFMNPLLLRLHLQQIHKFDALWIPDEANENNLSGKLSHDINFKIPTTYIGIQSRFSDLITSHLTFLLKEKGSLLKDETALKLDNIDFDILVVLSGPEPQRTFLENELKKVLKKIPQKILFIQGKTETLNTFQEENITTISYLNTNDLFIALQKAKAIICRSGYSTIMDLAVLGKKAILIPTIGQTEQEYLSKTLAKKGFAIECLQSDLNMEKALEKLNAIDGFSHFETSSITLEKEIEKYIIDSSIHSE